jgi:protein TonB
MPAYPAEARDKGEQGDVTVEVELDASGSIKATRITRSSGSISLDATALRSARTLRFRPPRPPDGTVLRHAVVVEIPFRFQLQ